jgi:hypothetical protein
VKLREAILKEHSKRQCLKIEAYVGYDKERFAELITLMLEDEYTVAQRAAWPVSNCLQKYPELIKPWLARMVKKLSDRTVHDSVRRNILRSLQDMDIPEKYCGRLFDLSNKYLHDLQEPVAVRAFSISVMENIARKYPELQPEVRINAESFVHCGIPAMESRARHILKRLKKL